MIGNEFSEEKAEEKGEDEEGTRARKRRMRRRRMVHRWRTLFVDKRKERKVKKEKETEG